MRSITIIRESRLGVSGLMLESMSMRQLYEAVEDDGDAKKGFMKKLWEKFRDSSLVDLGLDMLGLFGGAIGDFLAPETAGISAIIAMIPDLVNAMRRFARGDKFQGALSLICAIPFAGDAAAFFIQGERAIAGGGAATLNFIKGLSNWAKTHRSQVKTIQTGTGKIAQVVAEHIPGMEEHHGEIVDTVAAMTSGDTEKVMAVAKESGMKIVKREAGLDSSDERDSGKTTSESTIRRAARSHKIAHLYEGILY